MRDMSLLSYQPSAIPPHGHSETQVQPVFNVESVLEQGSGALNEDALLDQGPVFAVFDGASSLCGCSYEGGTGAWWASQLAREAFASCTHAELSLKDVALLANSAIEERMQTMGVDTDIPLNRWSASMAAFRIAGDSLEFVQIGDSLILCITDDGFFLPAPYVNHDRETLCQWKRLCATGEQDVRSALHERICSVRADMNRTYGALNGEACVEHFLQHGTVPLAGVRQVVAFTDGLHLPSAHPEKEADFTPAVNLLRTGGLEHLRSHIRQMESGDQCCRIYPRFKQHDDIAAVAVQLSR
ncbi:protein phosphatase 2C domain-containing protein [Desulfovibrio mangrovi]|uniref:protein phosphatase 2C domain-containing protein n=1 Tax=Desulfovibrio mangrovi TaxID=2976983 RepID=UPI00224835F0|nr:protein phosphatase 2C domain-containing protein [Desulfovibrio mangrovi]UZP65979.1 protein phosphatase 2C domain-containing protein [Desulfovibrio mangrovi]